MKSKKSFIVILLAFVLLMVGAYFAYDRLSGQMETGGLAERNDREGADDEVQVEEDPADEVGEEESQYAAPDFTVLDGESNEVKLSDYFGTPIVLNFWASWCGPCKSEMPDFDEAAGDYQGQVQFLMVNLTDGSRETVDSARGFIEDQGYTFPVFYDTERSAAMAYGASAIPMTFFIDTDGNLVAYAQGAIDDDLLRTGIGMILPEEAKK